MPTHRIIQKITIVDGGNPALDLAAYFDVYYFTGTDTLTGNYSVTGSGTAYEGMRIRIEYRGTVTLGGNTITMMGTAMPDAYASKKVNVDCYYNGSAWVVDYQPAFDEADIITTAMINDDAITTPLILDANVTLAKIEAVTDGQLIIGNGSNRPTAVTPTGDIGITNAGVTSITADSIVNTDVNTAAAIALTKFAALPTTARALVSSGAGVITESATSTTEVEYLSSVTPGTASASKVAILGANKNLDTLVVADSGLFLGAGAGTAVTSTASELNILDGATLNVTEINYLDGSVPGTAVANKVLSLGASKDVDELDVISNFKLNGTQVTATATELNIMDGVTATTAQLNYCNTATSDLQVQMDAVSGKKTYTEIAASGALAPGTFFSAYIVATGGGVVTLTLPAANAIDANTTVSIIQKGANAASFARAGADTIQDHLGATVNSLACSGNGAGYELICDGVSEWLVIAYS